MTSPLTGVALAVSSPSLSCLDDVQRPRLNRGFFVVQPGFGVGIV